MDSKIISWGEHNPHKTYFLGVRLELIFHGPDEICFPMGLHLVSFPPVPHLPLPLYQSTPVFLCCQLGRTWHTLALLWGAGWPSCASCLLGRSKAASGDVMSVLSSFEGREDSFQLRFPFPGRKYISVLHSLSSYVYVLRVRDS